MSIKLIAADMDGTLLCTMRYWRFTTLEFLLAHDIIPTEAQLGRMYLSSSRRLCAEILAEHGIEMAPEAIVGELEGYMRRHYLWDAKPKPRVEEYLSALRDAGVKMCVGTGAPREFAREGLERLGLAQYFEFITDCYEYGLVKDDPAYFERMARMLGVRAEEMCVFEDALYSMQAAKRAGCPVIALRDDTQVRDWDEISRVADRFVDGYGALL